MKMKIAGVFKPVVLGLCMSAWAFTGDAYAASSHTYPSAGCQETYTDHDLILYRYNGFVESADTVLITCPIVIDNSSTQIQVTVFYEASLSAPPTYAGKPDLFTCEIKGYNSFAFKKVNLNLRNNQSVEGSLTLSTVASPRFNVLMCTLLGTQNGFNFGIYGYQVDET